jgi:hypothetical protein
MLAVTCLLRRFRATIEPVKTYSYLNTANSLKMTGKFREIAGGPMRVIKKMVALCMLLSLLTIGVQALQKEPKSIVAHANGNGVLKLGDEEFKVTSVIIKLFEGGRAELNLISEITVFVSGTWERAENDRKVINLKITGGATGGGVEASGDLRLRGEKQIERVSLQGESKTSHRVISFNFQAAD